MKTHFLAYTNSASHFACLFAMLLAVETISLSNAQQPEPVPDANGKIPYVPSPFPGIPPERTVAYQKALRTLTPEFLRTLPDDDSLLTDLFRFEAVSLPGRSPQRDMIEMEMWRRGDAAVQIVKNAFEHPATQSTPGSICLWLKYRPWMKPEEFLPLARRWYELIRAKLPNPKDPYIYGALQMTAEFFCCWGESQDESLINDYFNVRGVEQGNREFLMKKFKERQELRTQGKPRGMPEWFFDPKHKMDRHTAIPLSDCTKTYEEKKAEQAK